MTKLLLPVDGSDSSKRAAEFVASHAAGVDEVHLLNVQHSLPGDVSTFVNADEIKRYHLEEAEKELKAAKAVMERAGVALKTHVLVGDPAETIARLAEEHHVDQIVMGTHGRSGLSGMLMGSVAAKTLHLAKVPVLVVK